LFAVAAGLQVLIDLGDDSAGDVAGDHVVTFWLSCCASFVASAQDLHSLTLM